MAAPPARSCRTCSTPLPADAQFCPRCGSRTPTEISGGGTTISFDASSPDALAEQRERLQHALGADYVVDHLLGSGGFAQVWAAHDRRLDRRVAVKVLHPELVASRALIERFKREAQAVAKLRHPGIVPIYGVGEHEGLAWYIMPLVEGVSLRDALRSGPLPAAEARRILREAAAALAGAHKAGIVHRDIKPENIMLDGEERRVLVMDFGIAKSTAAGATGLTGTGMIIGTPAYMSPEQATASKEIGPPSDIYSLGVVGFEMIAGATPFQADSVPELVMKQVAAPAPSLGAVKSDTPDDLVIAINRCLTKDPAERWSNAGELAGFLEERASPLVSATPVSRQLRRFARRGWRPSRAQVRYGTAAVVVAATVITGLARPDLIYQVRDYWGLLPAEPVVEAPPPARGVRLERNWSAVMVALGDEAVGVWDRFKAHESFHVFDGVRWSSFQPPEPIRAVAQADRSALLFSDTTMYRWSRTGIRRESNTPFVARTVWERGPSLLLSGQTGNTAWRTSAGWQRHSSPRRTALSSIIGLTPNQLVALGAFVMPDSVLEYQGVAWESIDPRPGGQGDWRYNAAVTLADGTLLIGGRAAQAPLLLRRDRDGPWRAVPIRTDSGVSFEIDGMWARTADTVFAWQRPWGCYQHCVAVITASALRISSVHSGVAFLGMASLRGVPHALRSDGTLWKYQRGQWAHVAEVPALVVRYRAVAEFDSGWTGARVGDGIVAVTSSGNPVRNLWLARLPERRFRGLAAGIREAWLLGESGTVYHADCRSGPRCALAPLALAARVAAIARLDSGFVAVGAGGFIQRHRTGATHPLRLPAGAEQENLVGVAVRPDRSFVVLGQDHLFSHDAAGRGRVLASLPPFLRGAGHVAATLTGGAVVATDRGDIAIIDSLGEVTRIHDAFAGDFRAPLRVTSVLTVDSLRIALTLAQADEDPYGTGGVFIVSLSRKEGTTLPVGDDPRARARSRFYTLLVAGDTSRTWDGIRGPWLVAFGDGGLTARWPIASLPQ